MDALDLQGSKTFGVRGLPRVRFSTGTHLKSSISHPPDYYLLHQKSDSGHSNHQSAEMKEESSHHDVVDPEARILQHVDLSKNVSGT